MIQAESETGREAVDIFRRFVSFEQEHGLFELYADGVPIWGRIRNVVGSRLQQRRQYDDTERSPDTSAFDPNQLLRDAKNTAGRLLGKVEAVRPAPLWADEAEYLFWGRSRRSLGPDGLWWDIYCDILHERLEYDYVHVERPKGVRHLRPAKTERLYYLDLLDDVAALGERFSTTDGTLPSRTREQLVEVERLLAAEFGEEIDVTGIAEAELRERRRLGDAYRWLVERIDPEVAVALLAGNRRPMLEACADADIPTVEFQHGLTSPYHYGYSFPETVDGRGFPDYFFSFGDYWTEVCEFPYPDDRVRTVGFPHLEAGLERYAGVDDRPQVVFVSQETVGTPLSKAAAALSDSPRIDADVVYKLAWAEKGKWRSAYPWLADADVRVIDDETQLYRLFAESTVQVGVYSTAVFEGLAFDLETYLLDLPGIHHMEPLIEETDVRLCGSTTELVDAVADGDAGEVDTRQFFEPDAVENVRRELERVRTAHE